MTEQLSFEHLRRWGFAPGSYHCFCSECGKQHTGDKRSWRCLDCAEAKVIAEQQNTRPSASREIAVKKLDFVWTKDEYADNPTTYRTIGDGYSAYVLIPYGGDNDPEAGLGTWNGVAQHRGQTEFASKEAAIEYCEQTIRDFAQAKVNAASNFIALTPTPGNTDPMLIAKYDDELRKVQGGWRGVPISTFERLPEKPGKRSYEHVRCLIFIKGEWEVGMWNCEHLVWDDDEGDDFRYHPTEPTHWMPLPPAPTEHPTEQPSVRDAARVLLDYLPNYAMENAALESRARDDEGEFASLSDLLDFSGQNKAYTVVREALAAALRSLAQEGE